MTLEGKSKTDIVNVAQVELTQIECPGYLHNYLRFAWLSSQKVVFICQNLSSIGVNELLISTVCQENVREYPTIYLKASVKRFQPIVGTDQKSILINDLKKVYKIKINLTKSESVVQEKILDNALLYSINVISWDEARTGCYALLNDEITIKHFDFTNSQSSEEMGWELKLSNRLICQESRQLHISRLGSMAIAVSSTVYYFKAVQPHVTRKVKTPLTFETNSFSPFSVISRDWDKKWFVGWVNKSGLNLRIYQYSKDFEIERSVHTDDMYTRSKFYPLARSFSFLDENHLVVERQGRATHTYKDLRQSAGNVVMKLTVFKIVNSQIL